MYAKHLLETKKFDIRRISTELKLKGIDREIIENVTKTLDNEPIQRIIEMLSTKFSNGFKDEKTKKRFIAKLQRMGYSWSDIKSAFSEYEIDIEIKKPDGTIDCITIENEYEDLGIEFSNGLIDTAKS